RATPGSTARFVSCPRWSDPGSRGGIPIAYLWTTARCGALTGHQPVDNSGDSRGSVREARLPPRDDRPRRHLRAELAQDAGGAHRHPVDEQVLRRQVERPPGAEVLAAQVADALGLLLQPLPGELEALDPQRLDERPEV